MKVYRGFNKEIGPISYSDWIYVESSFDKEIKNIIRNAGVQLNEEILDAKAVGDDLMNIILKNPTRRELRDNKMNTCRGALGRNGNFYFIEISDLAHCDLFDTLEKMGINEGPYHVFKYSNKTNTFYYYDPDNDLDEEEIKKELESSPHFKSFAGCHFDYFDDPDFDPDLYESYNPLNESVKLVNKDFCDTKLITTASEMNEYLKNHTESRFVYDTKKKWYLVDNAENSIHINLLNDALVDGYYEPFEYKGKMINADVSDLDAKAGKLLYETNPNRFLLFRTSSDQLNGEEYYYDRYKYCYVYNDYCIFDRHGEFKGTTLYELLGKPKDIEFIGDIDADKEELNEEIVYGEMVDDNMMVILHNPSRKELRDNNLDGECRIVYDGKNGYYFADSNYTHEQIENKLKSLGLPYVETLGEFYYYGDNLFATRDDWNSKKEYLEYKNDWYNTLKSMPYIIKNFGNFKADIFKGEYIGESVAYEGRLIGDTILKNPTRKELREWDLMNCRVVLDWNTYDFYFGDAYINIHDDIISKVDTGENDSLYYDCYNNTFYKRDEYRNENEKTYMEKSLSQWLSSFEYIKNTFGGFNAKICMEEDPFESAKIVGNQLNEEIIHAEKSNYDDYMAVVLKNPTKRELRENGLNRSRFICFEDGTWLFFDSMQWIHAHIWNKYKDKFNGSNNMGFYDLSNNEFIFIESLDYDEDEEGYEEEVSYYENKCRNWLLNQEYVVKTFGTNFYVTIYGDWVDNPW